MEIKKDLKESLEKISICGSCKDYYTVDETTNGYCKKCRPQKDYELEYKEIDYVSIDSFNAMTTTLISIILNLFKGLFYLLCATGYILNFHAIYIHWTTPLTLQSLAEFIGVIVFPLGIITGWLHIL